MIYASVKDISVQLDLNARTSQSSISKFIGFIMNWLFNTESGFKYEVASSVFYELLRNTPVKSGWARASWSVGIDAPNNKSLPRGSYGWPSFNAPSVIGRKSDYIISNDAPHIERLNEGWSAQAPAGFVDLSIYVGARQAEANFR